MFLLPSFFSIFLNSSSSASSRVAVAVLYSPGVGGAEVDERSLVGVADLEGIGRGGRIGTGRA